MSISCCYPWNSGGGLEEDYDYCRHERRHLPLWKLIKDPSGEMILGGHFFIEDIRRQYDGIVWDNWSPGTKFQNIKTGKVIVIFMKIKYKKTNDVVLSHRTLHYKDDSGEH